VHGEEEVEEAIWMIWFSRWAGLMRDDEKKGKVDSWRDYGSVWRPLGL
jgi:hypothetical protein